MCYFSGGCTHPSEIYGDTMIEELWPKGPKFNNDESVFRPGIDSILLAYFANNARQKTHFRAVDLGCGSGIISILLAWDAPESRIDGVEIQCRAAELAAENAKLSGLSDRITIINGDLRCHRSFLRAGVYDIAISNPPYYLHGGGKLSIDKNIAIARGEESCTLIDICNAAAYLIRWGGSFFLVHKPERLNEIFNVLSTYDLEPKRLRFVQHTYSSPPSLVLIESRRGGKPTLKVEAPFILTNEDGSDTDEAKIVYRR